MDRVERLLSGIDLDREVGLEIGPLDNPLVHRTARRAIYYADYADREHLQNASRGDPHVDIERIPVIDYMIPPPLPLTLDRQFDYIVASHVAEHVPDLLGWLQSLFRWLSPNGRVVLAIPDRRYTFDYIRSSSTTGDLLEAYFEKRATPSFHSVYDGFSRAMTVETARAWREQPYLGPMTPMYSRQVSLNLAKHAHETGEYRDCHCSVFTYESFIQIIDELNEIGVCAMRIVDSAAPVAGANEFHVKLAPA